MKTYQVANPQNPRTTETFLIVGAPNSAKRIKAADRIQDWMKARGATIDHILSVRASYEDSPK